MFKVTQCMFILHHGLKQSRAGLWLLSAHVIIVGYNSFFLIEIVVWDSCSYFHVWWNVCHMYVCWINRFSKLCKLCVLFFFIRFFLDIASDCPASDSVNHSLSFISDGNVLALHRLLWNNQEKIGQYLSSNRCLTCLHPRWINVRVAYMFW